MAKIHDLFIIELAEVIKGYGNDPDVEDPFRLSEFYRFYELPNIAVSRENFEKMRPAQPELQWIPVNKELPKKDGEYLVTVGGEATFPDVDTAWFYYGHWIHQFGCTVKVIAWMPLPEPYKERREDERPES